MLVMAVYLVVAIFSQDIHQHNHGVFLQFEKGQKHISDQPFKGASKDCLSCHFLLDGHALEMLAFDALDFQSLWVDASFASTTPSVQSSLFLSFYLRGPPFLG